MTLRRPTLKQRERVYRAAMRWYLNAYPEINEFACGGMKQERWLAKACAAAERKGKRK